MIIACNDWANALGPFFFMVGFGLLMWLLSLSFKR